MKGKLYTKSGNVNLLKKIDNNCSQYTASEHAFITKKEYGNFYSSKDLALNFSFSTQSNYLKFETIPLIVDFIKKNNYRNILSMGSGDCSMEHLLAYCLGEGRVIATDFDSFYIDCAKNNFQNITAECFDFFKKIFLILFKIK
ncbi:MAG: hypothetical protein HQK49_10800 [Oligoflexia bacterium]|nr:hypothetical protein [Oligoflexia bacterium]